MNRALGAGGAGLAATVLATAIAFVPARDASAVPFIYNTGDDVFEVSDIPADAFAMAAQSLVDQGLIQPEALGEATEKLFREPYGDKKFGYMCKVFGLFYAYIAWWNCKPVFFKWTGSNEFGFWPLDLDEYAAQMAPQFPDPDARKLDLESHKALIAALVAKAGKPVGTNVVDAYPQSSTKMSFWARHGRFVLGAALILIIVGGVIMKRRKGAAEAPPPAAFPPAGQNYPPPGQNYPPVPGAPPQGGYGPPQT